MKTKSQNRNFYHKRALLEIELLSCEIELDQLVRAGHWPERQAANLKRQDVLIASIHQVKNHSAPVSHSEAFC